MRAPVALAVVATALLRGEAALACSISTGGVILGNYDTTRMTPTDGVGTVDLDCHRNDAPVISLSTGSSGSFATRRMTNGTSVLQYNLYRDASRTIILGSGGGGTATLVPTSSPPSGSRRRHVGTIYGRIPARQNVTAGDYSDSLILTVTF
jgi:spore coat protein U-like protein